jgi:hypothetical protein
MATTTNYGWTTPDDTALVKDGASAIRSLGTSVDTTTKNLNPSTTLGDIEYRSSTANTNTRLGIGSTGNVLTVAGGVPTWAAPAGGGKNYTLLNAGGTSLSGSTTTISGISGQDSLMIVITGASSSSAGGTVYVRLNNSSTDYTWTGYQVSMTSSYSASIATGNGGTGQDAIYLGVMSSDAASTVRGAVKVDGCNSSGSKVFTSVGGGTTNASTDHRMYSQNGIWANAATISSIVVGVNTGSFDAGTIYIYGSA